MKVAVLGVGLIGGSVGLAARRRGLGEVVGFDPDRESLERALAAGAIDRTAADVVEACADADLVVCAAPGSTLTDLAAAALAASGPDTVVTDVGSTKREIVAALGAEERFVGGHPLAGAEGAGAGHARADLFEGARWYLVPGERAADPLYERLERTVAELGARPLAVEAEAHDRLMATVSHLPHVLANVLVEQAATELTGEDGRAPEVGPSFRDATRVAGANPSIWVDIFGADNGVIAAAVENASERLRDAAALIRSGDRAAIAAWHEAAREDHLRQLGRRDDADSDEE